MTDAVAPPAVLGSAPDWSAITGDVLCPLCEYNLRGLAEPRCPECGYKFEWPEVLDQESKRHPYLFEENPHRNISSFIATFAGSFLPGQFWQSLKPVHRPRPRRLSAYTSIVLALLVVGFIVMPGIRLARAQMDVLTQRNIYVSDGVQSLGADVSPEKLDAARQALRASSHQVFPSVLTIHGVKDLYRTREWIIWIFTVGLGVGWPAATFATLMIFQVSMRRAKIRKAHVARCAIYGCNAVAWMAVLALIASPLAETQYWTIQQFLPFILLAASMAAIVTFYHVGCAYRFYLKFDRPWLTIAASQVIVWLAFCTFGINLALMTSM